MEVMCPNPIYYCVVVASLSWRGHCGGRRSVVVVAVVVLSSSSSSSQQSVVVVVTVVVIIMLQVNTLSTSLMIFLNTQLFMSIFQILQSKGNILFIRRSIFISTEL